MQPEHLSPRVVQFSGQVLDQHMRRVFLCRERIPPGYHLCNVEVVLRCRGFEQQFLQSWCSVFAVLFEAYPGPTELTVR